MAFCDLDAELWWFYFLTGRSEGSRGRRLRFVVDRLLVEPTSASPRDPLRHYACATSISGGSAGVVVGNGDHVEALADAVAVGDLASALAAIDPEGDPPIHTPRIALVLTGVHAPVHVVSIRQAAQGVERCVHTVRLTRGSGLVIHTYGGTSEEVAVEAEPRSFESAATAQDLAESLWTALDPGLRVALAYGLSGSPAPIAVLS